MSGRAAFIAVFPALLAVYWPFCTPELRPTAPPAAVRIEELWERPENLPAGDLYHGPWGPVLAPDPKAIYTFVKPKTTGVNPGMTVTDPSGRTWHIKQAPRDDRGHEGPIEVVLSRVLSAVGYHQPPVYFVPAFTLGDALGTRTEPGGRFRLDHPSLGDLGSWSWQQNPFVGMRPYQGLLVILVMFNSSDIKNANNTLYEVRGSEGPATYRYVVRDLGTALGTTGRLRPKRGDLEMFEREAFVTGVTDGFVTFNYHGWHQELLRGRITVDDVRWASNLLAGLTEDQWRDAFHAGGYEPRIADRFIRKLLAKIAEGRTLGFDRGDN